MQKILTCSRTEKVNAIDIFSLSPEINSQEASGVLHVDLTHAETVYKLSLE